MSKGEQTNGGPFSGDYPDPRTPEQRAKDQRAVCRQVGALVRQLKDDSFEREIIRAMLRRRSGRTDDLVQFEVVGGSITVRGRRTLVVRGELLVEEAVDRDDGARRMLERFGLKWAPIDCLEGRVGRLQNPDLDANRYVDIARLLRRSGFTAAANHIEPLAPVIKGEGGPEPTQVRLEFPPAFTQETEHATVVAVIDTGITSQRRSDGWLSSVAREADNIDLLDDIPARGGDGFLDFGAGHGTYAAGVVQQVAPAADLRVYKAVDSDGIGSEVDVACAMVQAVRDGAQIINLSLGVQTIDDQPPVAIAAALDLINELTKGEVIVVAAAGNDGNRRPCWPAAFRSVVSVAGLTADLTATEWSNRGFWITCSTVGEGLVSPYVKGTESHELDRNPDTFPADAWAAWTGTSFAAPQIAGAVARLADEGKMSPRDALRELLRTGRPVPDFGTAVQILPGT
jgi:subtilisin family serine protease